MSLPCVTVLVPMRNEEEFIETCLTSICAQDYPEELLEIIVLDGESTDKSCAVVSEMAVHTPRIRLLNNPGRLQARAMNIGIEAATGEIIVRADAHAIYGTNYVSLCVSHLVAGEAENVGGKQVGVGERPFSRAIATALNSSLGAGNADYRVATEPCYTDTVWLGSWYKKTLQELNGFNEDMPPNEDYELNCRLRARGGRILLDPALPSTYFPRSSPFLLWRQYFRYGVGKVRMLHLHPETLIRRQIIPPLFVLGLLCAILAMPLTPWVFVGYFGFYLAALIVGAVQHARKTKTRFQLLLPVVYAIMHIAWGLGFLWEFLIGTPLSRLRFWLRGRKR